jgi:hypothetical protein
MEQFAARFAQRFNAPCPGAENLQDGFAIGAVKGRPKPKRAASRRFWFIASGLRTRKAITTTAITAAAYG